jgi:prepilin-type N-terminal cleavage/methylation domain-containing protein
MRERGVTLVELVVVISVIGILAIALGFSYVGWQGAYKVEKATKELHTDLMDARTRALSQGRMYFVDFNFPAPAVGFGSYRIASDDDDDAEGDADTNGVIDAGHTFLQTFSPKTIDFPITFSGGGGPTIINFAKSGIVEPDDHPEAVTTWTICLTTTADPDYDCINFSQTKINMGKLTTQISAGGLCDADNCVAK